MSLLGLQVCAAMVQEVRRGSSPLLPADVIPGYKNHGLYLLGELAFRHGCASRFCMSPVYFVRSLWLGLGYRDLF